MKPVTSFRLDEELLKKAKDMGINLVQLFEATLAVAVKERSPKCPYCKQRIKK